MRGAVWHTRSTTNLVSAIASRRQRGHFKGISKRATQRPEGFKKPAHWSGEPPPEPQPVSEDEELSPTRYGDWVRNGIAVDF